jgi:DNA-nicking Smr family endonuclease
MLPDDDADDDEHDLVDPVVVPIEEAFDLHTFAPRDVGDAVRAYLEAAVEAGFREVRLIHGRGKGIQRDRVQRLLARHPLVLEFTDAPPGRGGWGATLVRLRAQSAEALE